ncbi:hypothetical protein CRUP_013263, partial [Coryphaenoides rupestris]
QDVELVLQLLSKEEFRTAHSVHSTVSRQMRRAGPTSPLTVQAQDLCQEQLMVMILRRSRLCMSVEPQILRAS